MRRRTRFSRALVGLAVVVAVLAPAAASSADVVSGNLLTNGDLETNTVTPWASYYGLATPSASSLHANTGTYSMLLSEVSGSWGASGNSPAVYQQVSGLSSGGSYTFSFYVYDPTGACQMDARVYDANNGQTHTGGSVALSASWNEVSETFTAGGTGTVQVWVHTDACSVDDSVYVDSAVLISGTVAWTGGSGASSSSGLSCQSTEPCSISGTVSVSGGTVAISGGSVEITNPNTFGQSTAGCGAHLTWNPLSWGAAAISDSLCGLEVFFVPDSAHVGDLTNLVKGSSGGASWVGAGVQLATLPSAAVTAVNDHIGDGCPTEATIPNTGQSLGLCSAMTSLANTAGPWPVVRGVLEALFYLFSGISIYHLVRRTLKQ